MDNMDTYQDPRARMIESLLVRPLQYRGQVEETQEAQGGREG